MKTIRIVIVAALVAAGAALAVALQPGAAATAPAGTVAVQGTGTVTAVPDRGAFTFGVVTPAKTAAAASAANTATMQKVVVALKQAGIAAADLQTTQISLDVKTADDGTIVGYTASSSVTAQLRDLGTAGKVVDAAVGAGADSVSGPSLSVADTSSLYRDALRAAVADAKAKAQALAAASGLTLGHITSVSEGGATPIFGAPTASKADGSIEPGTQEVSATVSVTFAAGGS